MSKISHEAIQQFGFQVIENAIDISLIDRFNTQYKEVTSSILEPWKSYLPSRSEYLQDELIVDLIHPQMLDEYAKSINRKFSVHMVEARIGSSNIQWHRDFNNDIEQSNHMLDEYAKSINRKFSVHMVEARIGSSNIQWHRDFNNDIEQSNHRYGGLVPNGDHYYGAIIALEDFGPNCGSFEVVPYSHTLHTDPSIINYKNLMDNPRVCYEYYEKLVAENMARLNTKTYNFKAKKGDFIIWHGLAIHRGKQSDLPQEDWVTDKSTYRNSLFFHFSVVNDEEMNKVSQTVYVKSKRGDNLYLSNMN